MKKVSMAIVLLILLISIPQVNAIQVECSGAAGYSDNWGVWLLKCNVSDSSPYLSYYAKVGLRTTDIRPIHRGFFEIWISQLDLANFTPDVLPDVVFARMTVPVTIYIIDDGSNGTSRIAEKHIEPKLKMSLEGYILSLIWGILALLFLFLAGYVEWNNGKGLVGELLFIYLIFRGAHVPSLSALLLMPFTTFPMMADGRSEASALILSGISALLLFESAYALGIARSKYPKISFYTGLGWMAGLPIAFSFHWDDFLVPFSLTLLLAVPIAIILWKYAELPYSKCHKVLSLFRTYSVPLSVGVALIIALNYFRSETLPVFLIFMVSLFIYVHTSKLAFDKLVYAKERFDEDIMEIGRKGAREHGDL